jgi:tetratricopeptide (TPR) repeat protein
MTGDYQYLQNQANEHRLALKDARSALATALDRLGEHHVKNKEYDDAMDAFTEALHEKRSVYAQLIPFFAHSDGNRSRANSDDAQLDVDSHGKQLRDETVDSIVQTLKNMGNVHSLRGEQDEAMRYYTEVTNLRASRTSVRDATSVESFSKSSFYGTSDEDTSTLMSELNEDVRALDDLFRSISFRNVNNTKTESPKSVAQSLSTKSSDSPRKRRRGDGLRENASCENEPFKRSISLGTRSNNELTEALDSYRSFIDSHDIDKEFHEEQLNSFTLRADLLQETTTDGNESSSWAPAEGHPTRVAELQLAMELYRIVLSLLRKGDTGPTSGDDNDTQASATIASTMIRMGSLYYKMNNVDEELEMYREAKAVYTKAFGENHAYVAGTRKNIGMVLAERGEYDEAIEQFEMARLIYLEVNNGEENSRDVASAISCMGNVMNRMGELDEALNHYVHALRIYQLVRKSNNADDDNRDVIATLKIIGMVYGKKGELDTAMEYFSQAMGLIRSLGVASTSTGKENIASISTRIAGIHFKKGEYDQAMEHYQEAHDLTVELKGVNHPEVAGIKHYIGGIHHKNQDYEEAMQCYQEAVRVYYATLGPGHPASAATLVCIGSLHYKRRNLDSAMMFYREALRLNRDAYGLHHPDVAPTLKSIGTILTKKGEYDEAYQVFRDVLSIKCTVHGTGHPEVANAYKSLGNIHYKRGELADAERQYRHALNIYRRTKGEDDPETVSARTSIDHIRYWMKERGQRQIEGRESKSSTRRISDDRC